MIITSIFGIAIVCVVIQTIYITLRFFHIKLMNYWVFDAIKYRNLMEYPYHACLNAVFADIGLYGSSTTSAMKYSDLIYQSIQNHFDSSAIAQLLDNMNPVMIRMCMAWMIGAHPLRLITYITFAIIDTYRQLTIQLCQELRFGLVKATYHLFRKLCAIKVMNEANDFREISFCV